MGRKKRQPASKTRAATPLVIVSEPPVQARRASTPVQSGRRPRAPTPMPSGPRHFELRPAAAAVLSGTSKEPADLSNCPCDLIQSSTLTPSKPSPKEQGEVKDKQDLELEDDSLPSYCDVMKDNELNDPDLFELRKKFATLHTNKVLKQITGRRLINKFKPLRTGYFEQDNERKEIQSLANEIFTKFSNIYSICRSSLITLFMEKFSEENLVKLQPILYKSAMVKGLIFEIVEARALMKFDKVSVPILDSLRTYDEKCKNATILANPKIYSEETRTTIKLLLKYLKELSEIDHTALEFMTGQRESSAPKHEGSVPLEPIGSKSSVTITKPEESTETDGSESDFSFSSREDPDAQVTTSDSDAESDVTLRLSSKIICKKTKLVLSKQTLTSKGQTVSTADNCSCITSNVNNESANAKKTTKKKKSKKNKNKKN